MEGFSPKDNTHSSGCFHFLSIRRLSMILTVLVTLLLITTIVFIVLYATERNLTHTKPEIQNVIEDTCLTPYCIKAANYLLESMDPTVNPCEDFYQFTCGNWIKNTRIPDDAGAHMIFDDMDIDLSNTIVDLLSTSPNSSATELKAIVNSRRLYSSCMDEVQVESEGVNRILSMIKNEFGGWPILEGSKWNSSLFNFSQLFLKLQYYSSAIYAIYTDINDRNSSVHGIRISQGSLGLSDGEYYAYDDDITNAYKTFIRDICQALTNETNVNDTEVLDIFNFEREIAKYYWSPSVQNLRNEDTVYTTFGDLMTKINTTFDFANLLQQLYGIVNITVVNTDLVTITELEYIRNVSILISQYPARTLQNYLIWRFVMDLVKYMPAKYRAIELTFNQIFQGITSEPKRSKTCSIYVNNNMDLAVSKLYIREHFDEASRTEAIEMIKYTKNAMINIINQSTWMDSDAKIKAIEKARLVGEKVGYPENLNNDTLTTLEKEYAGYEFNASFIGNVLLVLQLRAKANYRELRQSVDRKSWFGSSAALINAYYAPSLNDIFFPGAFLQSPVFNKDAPKYLNYGATGAVIGHELTHGFDNIGRLYDKNGNKYPWWSNQTSENFNNRKTCIVEQYSNYTVSQVNEQINSQQTQGEDIADNGGLKEAFYAYQKWNEEHPNVDKKLPGLRQYTQEQLFFLNYGHLWCTKRTDQFTKFFLLTNVHSPPEFRVIGATSNFDEFDRVFGCKPGQKNSRTNKCSVW